MPEIKIIALDFADPSHCDALVTLLNHYISDRMGGGVALDNLQQKKLVEGLRNHSSKLVFLAKSGDEYVGLIIGYLNFATFTVKQFINIHDVVVLDIYRNKGIGRLLMQRIEEYARETGCSKITLEVREDNHNAQRLYRDLGFEECTPKMYFWIKYI